MELAKRTAKILSDDLRQHIPVRQIAERFSVSETSLKNYFRGVYGQNISPKVEEYRGKKIEIYPLGKTANFLSVLSGDGYLVISYHKLLIERVIDAIKDGTSLSDDVVFSNHKVITWTWLS